MLSALGMGPRRDHTSVQTTNTRVSHALQGPAQSKSAPQHNRAHATGTLAAAAELAAAPACSTAWAARRANVATGHCTTNTKSRAAGVTAADGMTLSETYCHLTYACCRVRATGVRWPRHVGEIVRASRSPPRVVQLAMPVLGGKERVLSEFDNRSANLCCRSTVFGMII